jgi:hypothetical protein
MLVALLVLTAINLTGIITSIILMIVIMNRFELLGEGE